MRWLATAATPGVARTRAITSGASVESARLLTRLGGDTYTSACSDVSSQRTTLWRKLSIMIPTPTDAATAIMRAAIATAVRLSAAVTPRVAIRPSKPKAAPGER